MFEERFRFRHALIHEAAYTAITRADRARLHEAAADLLEARGSSDEIVGFHLEQAAKLLPSDDRRAAKIAEDAGRHLGAAGIATWKRSDARSAARLCGRAAALLPQRDPQRLELLCELGVALNTTGEPMQARDTLREAAELGERRIELRARFEEGLIASSPTRATCLDCSSWPSRVRPVFEAFGDDRALGRVWMATGWVRGGAFGQHAEWKEAAERARATTSAQAGRRPLHRAYRGCSLPRPVARFECGRSVRSRCATKRSTISQARRVSRRTSVGCTRWRGVSRRLSTPVARTRIYSDRPDAVASPTCAPIEARAARLRDDLELAAETLTDSCRQLLGGHGGFHLATQAAELADVLCELDQLDGARWC